MNEWIRWGFVLVFGAGMSWAVVQFNAATAKADVQKLSDKFNEHEKEDAKSFGVIEEHMRSVNDSLRFLVRDAKRHQH